MALLTLENHGILRRKARAIFRRGLGNLLRSPGESLEKYVILQKKYDVSRKKYDVLHSETSRLFPVVPGYEKSRTGRKYLRHGSVIKS